MPTELKRLEAARHHLASRVAVVDIIMDEVVVPTMVRLVGHNLAPQTIAALRRAFEQIEDQTGLEAAAAAYGQERLLGWIRDLDKVG